ncbi:MAG: hypothetical protein QXK12_09110 [Candidatus Nezhaarchaeales archaeon]
MNTTCLQYASQHGYAARYNTTTIHITAQLRAYEATYIPLDAISTYRP